MIQTTSHADHRPVQGQDDTTIDCIEVEQPNAGQQTTQWSIQVIDTGVDGAVCGVLGRSADGAFCILWREAMLAESPVYFTSRAEAERLMLEEFPYTFPKVSGNLVWKCVPVILSA